MNSIVHERSRKKAIRCVNAALQSFFQSDKMKGMIKLRIPSV